MNCRPGDLAVIVRGSRYERKWIGKVVQLTTLQGPGLDGSALCWGYEGPRLVHPLYGACTGLADSSLRPIRDQPGEDETLQWAGHPHKQGEPA